MVVHDVSAFRKEGEGLRGALRRASGDLQATLYARGALSASGLNLPDFIGIGAQKSGTTWLYHNLRAHPDLFLPDRKELHYFDHELHRGLKWYARHFEGAGSRVKGEITPSYGSIRRGRILYVRKIIPEARIIFLMRNPVDRAWSQAKMNLVKRRKITMDQVPDEHFFAHFSNEKSIKRGSYRNMLEAWLSIFPEEQVLIRFFEDVSGRPKELLSDVFRHIGASLDVEWEALPYNKVIRQGVGEPMPEKFRTFLQNLYRDEIHWVADRFGSHAEEWRKQL